MNPYQRLVSEMQKSTEEMLEKAVYEVLSNQLVPLISAEKFAELCGMEASIVKSWCYKRTLPSKKIGKYRMINVSALQAQCLNSEQD